MTIEIGFRLIEVSQFTPITQKPKNNLRICKISALLSSSIFSEAIQQDDGPIVQYRIVGRWARIEVILPHKGGEKIYEKITLDLTVHFLQGSSCRTLFLGQIWIYHLRLTNCQDCVQKEFCFAYDCHFWIKLLNHNHLRLLPTLAFKRLKITLGWSSFWVLNINVNK